MFAAGDVSEDQVRALGYEAGCAGDADQAETCAQALAGNEYAWAECAYAIFEAQAQGEVL